MTRQIDDHLGRVLAWLESSGRMADTMIVFASDHGDDLGDHRMGEKELFHESEDPSELVDLGRSSGHAKVRQEMHGRLLERLTDRRNRITVEDDWVLAARDRVVAAGIVIGRW